MFLTHCCFIQLEKEIQNTDAFRMDSATKEEQLETVR